jgi:bifunctional non-homologous end joining protein LigD
MGLPLVRRREILKKLLPKGGLHSVQRRHRSSGNRVLPCGARTRLGGDHGETKREPVFARAPVGKLAQIKIKARMQQETVIGGITEPSGGRHYFGALMLGVYDKGRLLYVGHTRTGFSEVLLKDLFGKLTPYFTDGCPFTPKPKANAPVKWVEPRFVCEVAFQEWTSDGKMRAPSFLGLRDDKDPKKVVREN